MKKSLIVAAVLSVLAFGCAPGEPSDPPQTTTTTTTVPGTTSTTTVPTTIPQTTVPPTTTVPVNISSWVQNAELPRVAPAEGPYPAGFISNFRTTCWPSHMNYDDPLVYPGQPGASHLHMFFGNTKTDYLSTSESLSNSGDSSCQGGPLNRSAYWIPALNDTNHKVKVPWHIDVYYKSAGVNPNLIKPMPEGLKIIAGNSTAVRPQPIGTFHWNCVGSGVQNLLIPTCPKGSDLQLFLSFPQCWDGVNLGPVGFQSHMAKRQGSGCPTSHPVALPEVTYNIVWEVDTVSSAGWHLSSDMNMDTGAMLPGGTTTHADWIGGWNPVVMSTLVSKCLNGGFDSTWGNLCNGTRLKVLPDVVFPGPYSFPQGVTQFVRPF